MNHKIALVLAATMTFALAACSSEDAPESSGQADSPAAASPSAASPSPTQSTSTAADGNTPISITIGDRVIEARLNESAAARDFVESMPVEVPSIRNIDIEYFGAVASPLTETGPFYDDVRPGDVVYYAPKDEVALIFEPTSSPGQLTKIGDITSDLGIFDGLPDQADIRYELR